MANSDNIPTLETIQNFNKDAKVHTEIVTSGAEKTNQLDSAGKSHYTLAHLNQLFGGINVGDYVNGTVLNEVWEYAYNPLTGYGYNVKSKSSLPYHINTSLYPDPEDNPNLKRVSDVNHEDVTKAQEGLLPSGSQIYPRSGYLANGMEVTAGTTHLRVLVGGESIIVAMSPVASGLVSALTSVGATIGVTDVSFRDILSTAPVTIPGRSANRTVSDRFSDYVSIHDFEDEVIDDDWTQAFTAAASYINSNSVTGRHSKVLTGMPGSIYEISSQVDLSGVSVDMATSTIKLSDNFPDAVAILCDCTGIVNGYTFKALIDGNKDNQVTDIQAVRLYKLTSPLVDIDVNGYNCHTILHVYGNTEKSEIHVGGYLSSIVVQEENETGGTGDISPDENIYHISGNACGTYFKRVNADSTSKVIFNVEGSDGSNQYAVDVSGGTKTLSLGGIIRTPNNAMTINAIGMHLDFDNLVVFAPRYDGVRVAICQSVSGSLHVNASSEADATAYGLILNKARYGGVLNYTNIAKAPLASYSVRLGDESGAVSQDNLIFNASGLDLYLDVQYCKRCIITATGLADLKIGSLSESCSINVDANFMINNVPLTIDTTLDGVNVVKVLGSVSTSVLSSYSTPIAGMRVELVRGAGLLRDSLYDGTAWTYATYA